MLLSLYSLWGGEGAPAQLPQAEIFVTPQPTGFIPTADAVDIQKRLTRLIPTKWFSTPAPARDAILGGASDILSWGKSFLAYAYAQMRLSTATGFWIDLFAYDYLGLTAQRLPGENDDNYGPRVRKELTRERVTRSGMYQALLDLTGKPPVILEPFLGGDTGGWDVSWWGWDVGNGTQAPGNTVGWGDSLPSQVFVTVFQTGVGVGVAFSGGWDTGYIGFDTAGQWVDDSLITGGVTQQDILDTINRTKPLGVRVWVRFA